jgi:endonuclease-3
MSKSPKEHRGDYKKLRFYHMKAKNIKACSKALLDNFSGKLPQELDKLITLPGVGRTTANCVMGNAFGLPGIT